MTRTLEEFSEDLNEFVNGGWPETTGFTDEEKNMFNEVAFGIGQAMGRLYLLTESVKKRNRERIGIADFRISQNLEL